jgi:hypothetical protein
LCAHAELIAITRWNAVESNKQGSSDWRHGVAILEYSLTLNSET